MCHCSYKTAAVLFGLLLILLVLPWIILRWMLGQKGVLWTMLVCLLAFPNATDAQNISQFCNPNRLALRERLDISFGLRSMNRSALRERLNTSFGFALINRSALRERLDAVPVSERLPVTWLFRPSQQEVQPEIKGVSSVRMLSYGKLFYQPKDIYICIYIWRTSARCYTACARSYVGQGVQRSFIVVCRCV